MPTPADNALLSGNCTPGLLDKLWLNGARRQLDHGEARTLSEPSFATISAIKYGIHNTFP
jgi:hypothetical protein